MLERNKKMSDKFEVLRNQLEGTPLENGKHSTNQRVLRRELDGFRRLFGNPNSKVEKRREREEKKSHKNFESK